MISDPQVQTSSTSMDSSSSGNSSRRNSVENVQFPKIGHSKKDKRKPKQWGTNKSYSIDQGFDSVTEEPFEEKDIGIKKQLPHLQMINDYLEFSQKISRNLARGRKNLTVKQTKQRRSSLPDVEEEIVPEDDESRNKYVIKLGLVVDQNEFNSKTSRSRRSSSIIKQIGKQETFYDDQPIPEDLRENIRELKEPQAPSPYQIQSPKYKLKVDECDNVEKKQPQWNLDSQEVILEDKAEDEHITKGRQMFNKIKHLLTEERQFFHKIMKGEMIDNQDISRGQQEQEGGPQVSQTLQTVERIQEVEASSGESDGERNLESNNNGE